MPLPEISSSLSMTFLKGMVNILTLMLTSKSLNLNTNHNELVHRHAFMVLQITLHNQELDEFWRKPEAHLL
jgi:hypothetical protein